MLAFATLDWGDMHQAAVTLLCWVFCPCYVEDRGFLSSPLLIMFQIHGCDNQLSHMTLVLLLYSENSKFLLTCSESKFWYNLGGTACCSVQLYPLAGWKTTFPAFSTFSQSSDFTYPWAAGRWWWLWLGHKQLNLCPWPAGAVGLDV